MIKTNKLRKEKELLKKHIQTCTSNLTTLNTRKEEFNRLYSSNQITDKYYKEQFYYGIQGKSFEHWIDYNTQLIQAYNTRLIEIETVLNKSNQTMLTISLSLLIILSLISFSGTNPTITSNVIFGESSTTYQNIDIQFNESSNYTISVPEGSLNQITFDGEFIGKGVTIYVESDTDKKLFSRFETAINFSRHCGGICDDLFDKPINMIIELDENSSLKLYKINYQKVSLKEYNIEPTSIELSQSGFVNLTISNPRNKNFTVITYVEGPLADYITLYDSIIEFGDKDKQKTISYRIEDVPESITGKIIFRYVPKVPFRGPSPVEVHQIKYKAKKKITLLHIFLIILCLNILLLLITFFKGKSFLTKKI